MLSDKNILITGGTGSFGKKATEIILKKYKARRLIIFSRDELKQFEMSQTFSMSQYPCMRYFIGDVRDRERLNRAFYGVDYVIHAAALKQVPAAEYNPFEAVKTNIIGAQNVINVAIDQGVSKVMALSTDKAANPMGSRGSVIPFFLKHKDNGHLPITDPKMTRFWITLEQAVEFVLLCLNSMCGGELFVPKIPSMNIMDLARAIAPECETKIVGVRPGEKIHELMISRDDARQTLELDNFYVIQPQFNYWSRRSSWSEGCKVSDDFEYSSGTNPWRLSITEMQEMLKRL